MRARIIIKVNKRLWPNTANKKLRKPLRPNDIIEVAEEVVGEEFRSNKIWYKTNEGFYIWSGAAEVLPPENEILEVKNDSIIPQQFKGEFWRNKFQMLSQRPDIFSPIGRIEIIGQPGFVATGFCIKGNYVLTCYHVAVELATGPNNSPHWQLKNGVNCLIDFRYEVNGLSNKFAIKKNVIVSLNSRIDLAILEFDPAGNQMQVPSLDLAGDHDIIEPNNPLALIGHPAENLGGFKRLSTGSVYKMYDDVVAYSTIAKKGSSGSPVFNEACHVVAIHSASKSIDGKTRQWGSHHGTIRTFINTYI
jgi:hypothetical protein